MKLNMKLTVNVTRIKTVFKLFYFYRITAEARTRLQVRFIIRSTVTAFLLEFVKLIINSP